MYSSATPLKLRAFHFHFNHLINEDKADLVEQMNKILGLDTNQLLDNLNYISIISDGKEKPVSYFVEELKILGLKNYGRIKIYAGNNKGGTSFTKDTLARIIETESPKAYMHDFFDCREEVCSEVEKLIPQLAVLRSGTKLLYIHLEKNNLNKNKSNHDKKDLKSNNDLDVNHVIQNDVMSNQAFDLILDKINEYINETQKKIDGYLTRYMVNTKLSLLKLLLAKALQTALIQLNKKDPNLIYFYMRVTTLLNLAIEELSNKADQAFSFFQRCPTDKKHHDDIVLFFTTLLEHLPDLRPNVMVYISAEDILEGLSLPSNWGAFAARLLLKINEIHLNPKNGAGKEYLPWRSSNLDKLMKEIYDLLIDDSVIKEMQEENPGLDVPEIVFRHL